MDHNLTLKVSSLQDLEYRGDLAVLSDWAQGKAVDYMHQARLVGDA